MADEKGKYDEMGVDALKDEIRKRNDGRQYGKLALGGNKDELIARLEDDDRPLSERKGDDLREMLRERELPVSGTNEELVARLEEHDKANADGGRDDLGIEGQSNPPKDEIDPTDPNLIPGNDVAGSAPVNVQATANARGITPDAIGQPLTQDPGVTNPHHQSGTQDQVDPDILGDGETVHDSLSPDVTPDDDELMSRQVTGLEDDTIHDRRQYELDKWLEENPNATRIPPSLLPPAFGDPEIVTAGFPEGVHDPLAPQEGMGVVIDR